MNIRPGHVLYDASKESDGSYFPISKSLQTLMYDTIDSLKDDKFINVMEVMHRYDSIEIDDNHLIQLGGWTSYQRDFVNHHSSMISKDLKVKYQNETLQNEPKFVFTFRMGREAIHH